MSNQSCIFCKIVNGDIPSHKVYEDEDFLAFLDANPKSEGHTLVIPKEHFEDIFDLPEEVAKQLMARVKYVAEKLRSGDLNPDGIRLQQSNGKSAGQEIFHVHFHIIPSYNK